MNNGRGKWLKKDVSERRSKETRGLLRDIAYRRRPRYVHYASAWDQRLFDEPDRVRDDLRAAEHVPGVSAWKKALWRKRRGYIASEYHDYIREK